ncbi:MAG: hypothetical protein ACWGQW_05340 [bacterium]
MTEQEKSERTKKNLKRAWDGSKLIMAIGALTAAVNGYTDLSKKSVQLSEQNAALYKALSTKVNDMAERLAFLEGRIEGLNKKEAHRAARRKLWHKEEKPAGGGIGEEAAEMMDESEGAVEVEAAAPPEPERAPASIEMAPPPLKEKIKAYEQLPDNLEALMQNQQQVQQGM